MLDASLAKSPHRSFLRCARTVELAFPSAAGCTTLRCTAARAAQAWGCPWLMLPNCPCAPPAHGPDFNPCSYPEGHRSLLDDLLPLKTGMLKYAYSRRMPVQVRHQGSIGGDLIGGDLIGGDLALRLCLLEAVGLMRGQRPAHRSLTCCRAALASAPQNCTLPCCAVLRRAAQAVISANKEAVCSERQTAAHFGQTVVTGFSETVDPANYTTFEGERCIRMCDGGWLAGPVGRTTLLRFLPARLKPQGTRASVTSHFPTPKPNPLQASWPRCSACGMPSGCAS